MGASLYRKDNVALLGNLKGVSIALVVATHFPNGSMCPDPFRVWELFAHAAVPFFVLVSGYYMKADVANATTRFIEKIAGFLVVSSLIGFVYAWIGNALHCFNEKMPLVSNMGQFYLVLLIAWSLITPCMLRLRWWAMWGVIAVLFCVPYALERRGVNVPPLLFAAGLYTPFFYVGIALSWRAIVTMRDSRLKHLVALALIGGAFCFVYVDRHFEAAPFAIVRMLVRPLTASVVIFTSLMYFPGYRLSFLDRIGNKSLTVYLFHGLLVVWPYGHAIYPHLVEWLPQPYIGVISVAACVLTLHVLSAEWIFRLFVTSGQFAQRLVFKP